MEIEKERKHFDQFAFFFLIPQIFSFPEKKKEKKLKQKNKNKRKEFAIVSSQGTYSDSKESN